MKTQNRGNMNKKGELYGINPILILMLLLWFIVFCFVTFEMIDSVKSEVTRIEKVDCYDRYSNEIIGEECIEEIRCGLLRKIVFKEYCYGK